MMIRNTAGATNTSPHWDDHSPEKYQIRPATSVISDPAMDPSDTYLTTITITTPIGTPNIAATGNMTIAAPIPVATPRPPRRPANIDLLWPTTAATPPI